MKLFYCCDNDNSNDKAQLMLPLPGLTFNHVFICSTPTPAPARLLARLLAIPDLTARLSTCGPKFNLLLILHFDKTQTDLGEKQLVINPMGMLTVSSGMPLSLRSSRNGSDPKRLTENLGGKPQYLY